MSLKFYWIASAALMCASIMPATASACGMLYFDAYGMQKISCGSETKDQSRRLWSGLASHVSDNKSWSTLQIPSVNTKRIDILAGQKTLRAGDQNIMTIALVVDEHGNPAPSGEVTKFKAALYGTTSTAIAENTKGLSVWLMDEQTQSATGYISAQSRAVQSKRSDFHVVSAEATTLEIQPPKTTELSPSNQIELTAINIKDQFGNDKEDGALVRFQSLEPNGAKSFAQGIISNKRATAFPFNRGTQTQSAWSARIGAGVSQTVALKTNEQELLPLANMTIAQEPDTGTMTVKAGPFHTLAGHRVIDGTPIQFVWHDKNDNEKIELQTDGYMVDGWAKAIMPMPVEPRAITIEAHLLGARFSASVAPMAKSGVHLTTVEMEPQFHAVLRGAIS